ncbi:MAG: DNA mismatch repair protein MutS [bacterium]|nr:DNA mismatch repair protein MutS [bacterium]
MTQARSPSPMFRQYRTLKNDHPDAILLFRMGDFYEMFFEDAKVAAAELELTLTARGKGTENVVPMCGFPHHQLDAYCARLVRGDHRVAICDQVEDPKQTKGLVRREVVRVVTPGTVTDPSQLEAKENLWVASVATVKGHAGAAFLDVSTGEFLGWQPEEAGAGQWDALADRLRSFAPREILHAEDLDWPESIQSRSASTAVLTPTDPYAFSPATAESLLQRHFAVGSLDGFGFRERDAAVAAAGGLLQYLQDTQKCGLEQITEIGFHQPSCYLLLDPATRRNLELERSLRDGGRRGSLCHTVDSTVTPSGGRLLRRWLLAPLLDPDEILRRQDSVEEFVRLPRPRERTRELLGGVRDVERLLTRTVSGTAGPRDLAGLRASLERVPEVTDALAELDAPLLREAIDGLDPCTDVTERLQAALADEPPATLRDGGVVRDGFDAELDDLRRIRRDGKSYIASLEQKERETTGIAKLKVKYNKVFGYFIEVSKSNLKLVPESYQRKQTIANGERFVTPELKEYESKVLTAQERIETLELELFQTLRAEVAQQARRLKAVARAVALVDVLAALAETAVRNDYSRPVVTRGGGLEIVGGRHPVVEQTLTEGRFVPNDCRLEASGRAIAVLTGPNMGGKSTYLRQVALITLLAQAGGFVPAEKAELGVVDRIFCRVGASDSLAEGQSTFMVEMTETANILHHATPGSLLLLDEIGRGTSTFDGLSIAWAVIEHLHGLKGGAARTLFATHYHELTELAVELGSVLNLRMAVREWGDKVAFLHRVEAGASDRSYGIQVARLAGVPAAVVDRAKEILANLERDEYGTDGQPRLARGKRGPAADDRQTSLFGDVEPERAAGARDLSAEAGRILADLRSRDVNGMTPLEALGLLAEWKKELGE